MENCSSCRYFRAIDHQGFGICGANDVTRHGETVCDKYSPYAKTVCLLIYVESYCDKCHSKIDTEPIELFKYTLSDNFKTVALCEGIYDLIFYPDVVCAGDLIEPFEQVILEMKDANSDFCNDYSAEERSAFMDFINDYLASCRRNPDAEVVVK